MIWVFTVIRSNMMIGQTIHKGEFPNYELFLRKIQHETTVHPMFKEIYYDPLLIKINQELKNSDPLHTPHAGFKYQELIITCCGFKDA